MVLDSEEEGSLPQGALEVVLRALVGGLTEAGPTAQKEQAQEGRAEGSKATARCALSSDLCLSR